MKPINNRKYLVAEREGYSCYALPVNDETSELTLFLRSLHKERLDNAGYQGYSDDFDEQYHLTGTYFYVEAEGIVAATLRINKRSDELIFPFELGHLDNRTQYTYRSPEPAVDLSTYCLHKRFYKKATPLLFSVAANYILTAGVRRVFGLYDIKNQTIKNIHRRLGLGNSPTYTQPIFFDTFLHKESKEPVRWGIVEWQESRLMEYSEMFTTKYASPL